MGDYVVYNIFSSTQNTKNFLPKIHNTDIKQKSRPKYFLHMGNYTIWQIRGGK